jgi:hypothetical protein
MSNLHEMKKGTREPLPLQQKRLYSCNKIEYRETQQKCSQKHLDHIAELQAKRSKTKRKTAKALLKV